MADVSIDDVMAFTEERSIEPLDEHPDGYGLYEIVIAADSDPTLVRQYRGLDAIPRAIHLFAGGVTLPDGETDTYAVVDPNREHTRLVVRTPDQGVVALEGNLEAGTFQEVHPDE